MQRIWDVWLAIEDNLSLSTPEAFTTARHDKVVLKLWKWTMNSCLSGRDSGVPNTIKNFKSFIARVKGFALRSSRIPQASRGVPFLGPDGEVSHKLLVGHWIWLSNLLKHGLTTKSSATRLMHFVSTRGFPAPTLKEMERGVNEHGAVLCDERKWAIGEADLDYYSRIALSLGRYAKGRKPEDFASSAHLSMSDSASYDSSRRNGGRAGGFGKKIRPVGE